MLNHKVIWKEGLLLSPHIFQKNTNYIESVIAARLSSILSFDWGITDLRLNSDSISTGSVELLECSGVMPDGLVFSLPMLSPLPETRNITNKKNITDKDPDVYLAIPRSRLNSINYALNNQESGNMIRYNSKILSDIDESSGENPRKIEVASPNLKILFENESTDGYCTIKIAELERSQIGTLRYNDSYIPPLLRIGGSSRLISLLRTLGEFLSVKSDVLSSRRKQNKSGYAFFSDDDGMNLWLLSLINGCLPIINHYLNQRVAHPETIFKELINFAGSLSTISFDSTQNKIPDYDHNNLTYCFTQLNQTIRSLLNSTDRVDYIPIPLKLERPGLFVASIIDAELFNNCTFIVGLETSVTEERLLQSLRSTIKIAPRNSIETIISMALPGVQLTHLALPPKQIPIKAKYTYFQLEKLEHDLSQKRFWQEISTRESIAIWVAEEITDTKMEMYAIKNK